MKLKPFGDNDAASSSSTTKASSSSSSSSSSLPAALAAAASAARSKRQAISKALRKTARDPVGRHATEIPVTASKPRRTTNTRVLDEFDDALDDNVDNHNNNDAAVLGDVELTRARPDRVEHKSLLSHVDDEEEEDFDDEYDEYHRSQSFLARCCNCCCSCLAVVMVVLVGLVVAALVFWDDLDTTKLPTTDLHWPLPLSWKPFAPSPSPLAAENFTEFLTSKDRQALQAYAQAPTVRLASLWSCGKKRAQRQLDDVTSYGTTTVRRRTATNTTKHTTKHKATKKSKATKKAKKDDDDDPPPKNQLIFVHVYKTAGNTVKQVLKQYATYCKKQLVMVHHCSHLTMDSLTSVWHSENHTCLQDDRYVKKPFLDSNPNVTVKYKHDNTNPDHPRMRFEAPMTASIAQRVDILGGHMPLGVNELMLREFQAHPGRKRHDYQPRNATYVAFVRHPIYKFVSGKLFSNKFRNWTQEQAVGNITQIIVEARQKKETYNAFSPYFLTPEDQESEGSELPKTEADLAVRNLAKFPVVVCVLERMSENVQLMRQLLDEDLQEAELWEELDPSLAPPSLTALEAEAVVKNKSKLSTAAIVDILVRDPGIYASLRRYLRYEYRIYAFALELHQLQMNMLAQV